MEFCVKLLSLPSWERGLKSWTRQPYRVATAVAPLVGAWIEIDSRVINLNIFPVAPLVGAWIEIALWFRSRRAV